ncbi:hypothetical protein CVT26_014787 [Gymnopilus dilepis]|uniref:Uncharacterized protein n=1 Tax=Gymnopilus dilepis TaxID=231916 RepID=A0A409X3Y4_9AGAR|nr:hypothetical protein CVT26_014787 [Gymnopilus dilepis]
MESVLGTWMVGFKERNFAGGSRTLGECRLHPDVRRAVLISDDFEGMVIGESSQEDSTRLWQCVTKIQSDKHIQAQNRTVVVGDWSTSRSKHLSTDQAHGKGGDRRVDGTEEVDLTEGREGIAKAEGRSKGGPRDGRGANQRRWARESSERGRVEREKASLAEAT